MNGSSTTSQSFTISLASCLSKPLTFSFSWNGCKSHLLTFLYVFRPGEAMQGWSFSYLPESEWHTACAHLTLANGFLPKGPGHICSYCSVSKKQLVPQGRNSPASFAKLKGNIEPMKKGAWKKSFKPVIFKLCSMDPVEMPQLGVGGGVPARGAQIVSFLHIN